jgi:hypothetical protein
MAAWRQAAGRLRRRLAGRPPEGVQQVVQRTSPVPPIDPVVTEVREKKLTYLPVAALNDLFEAASTAERDKRPGVFIEAGCALGGSAIVLTKAKDPRRPLFVHDVFGMIPPPSDEDGADVHERYQKIKSGRAAGIGGNPYYGYETDLIDKVRERSRPSSCRWRRTPSPWSRACSRTPSPGTSLSHSHTSMATGTTPSLPACSASARD